MYDYVTSIVCDKQKFQIVTFRPKIGVKCDIIFLNFTLKNGANLKRCEKRENHKNYPFY